MRGYYRPGLTEDQTNGLDWENFVLVCSAQAALGLISSAIQAIFVAAPQGQARLHVVVAAGERDAIAEDVDDLVGELEALLLPTPDFRGVTAEVHIEGIPADWRAQGWRGLYWKKGWEVRSSSD